MPSPNKHHSAMTTAKEEPGFQICEWKNYHRRDIQLLLFAAADSDPNLPSPSLQLLGTNATFWELDHVLCQDEDACLSSTL